MLPRETTLRQLKKLRSETKGKDIGDLTSNDKLNHNLPNLQYIGNPVDNGIDSYEDFTEKDNKLQTIAFKSKLVNKPLVKSEKTNEIWGALSTQRILMNKLSQSTSNDYIDNEDEPCRKCDGHYRKTQMSKIDNKLTCDKCGDRIGRHEQIEKTNENMKKIIKFQEFEYEKTKKLKKNKKSKLNEEFYGDSVWSQYDRDGIVQIIAEYMEKPTEEINTWSMDELKEFWDDNDLEQYASAYIRESKEEKELKENPNFGIAAVKDQENKKIAFFNNFQIDPPTPKERPILNAGVSIDNDKVKGILNRIEGKNVYVESFDDPMTIKKFSLKDAVKTKKE